MGRRLTQSTIANDLTPLILAGLRLQTPTSFLPRICSIGLEEKGDSQVEKYLLLGDGDEAGQTYNVVYETGNDGPWLCLAKVNLLHIQGICIWMLLNC